MMSSVESLPIETLPPDACGGRLTIDLGAIAENYRTMKAAAGSARTSGVVKADAYGTGALPVARRLAAEGCDFFFVAQLGEALELRRAGGPSLDPCEIAVLNGAPPGAEAVFAEQRITPVLNTLEECERWVSLCRERGARLPAIVQVDTGMNRLGLSANEVSAFVTSDHSHAFDIVMVMSHLACADEPDHEMNSAQLARFRALLPRFGDVKASLANSAATLSGPLYCFDMVRPGIGLYGGHPFAHGDNPMKPVVSLHGRVLQVRSIDKGERVGYGARFEADSPRILATVSVGYADGYFRSLGNRAHAYINGVSLPVAGRVSMDLITLDVTDAPKGAVQPGGFVELLGAHVSVDDLGRAAGSFGYEVLTSLGRRYARDYV